MTTDNIDDTILPKVSVIIPAYNEEKNLPIFLDAISKQDYPAELVEYIFLDNGSKDATLKLLQDTPYDIIDASAKPGPYYARNLGFKICTGDLIILLDVNKYPSETWLTDGVKFMKHYSCKLLSGKIDFKFQGKPNMFNYVDSIMFFDNKSLIESTNSCAAGNLFFFREVLEKVGEFPEMRSGLDMYWTKKATSLGYKLCYSEDVVVYTKPKDRKSLLKKSFRVGTGHPFNWRNNGYSLLRMFAMVLIMFRPPKPKRVFVKNKSQLSQLSIIQKLALYFVFYLNKVVVGLGQFYGLVKSSR